MKKNTVMTIILLGLAGLAASLAAGPEDLNIPPEVQKVFKQHCVRCHGGPLPRKGLSLTAGKIASAIDAPSAEVPALKIIDRSVPEASYLLKKVRREEGIAGKPMPPGSPLTAEEIQILETWISGLK